MSTRVFGLLPLAKVRRLGKEPIEISLAPAAALATACGIGQRVRAVEKKLHA